MTADGVADREDGAERRVEQTIPLRVRYPEVDAMGYLHHSRYLQYFEIGRVELPGALEEAWGGGAPGRKPFLTNRVEGVAEWAFAANPGVPRSAQ